MSGIASTGNSTSTTGPVTRATRPTPVSTACAVISLFPRCGVRQRFRATDDLADFLGDLRLASLVHLLRELLDQLVGVVRGRLHGPAPRRLLRRRRLKQRREDPRLDV